MEKELKTIAWMPWNYVEDRPKFEDWQSYVLLDEWKARELGGHRKVVIAPYYPPDPEQS